MPTRLCCGALGAAVVFALLAPALAAQNTDSSASAVVMSESMRRGQYVYAVLAQDIAYRLEVAPRGALVTIRHATLTGRPVVAMRPLSDGAFGEQGATYLIVPRETDEYRIEVREDLGQDVRVRLIRDERESRLLAGRGRVPDFLTLGFRVSAIVSNVGMIRPVAGFTPRDSTVAGGLIGAEACLGVVRGAIQGFTGLGGCLLTVGRYQHGDGAMLLVGAAPSWRLRSYGALDLAAAVQLGFGQASAPYRRDINYRFLGAGPEFTWQPGGAFSVTVFPAITLAARSGYDGRDSVTGVPGPEPGKTVLVLRISAGVHFGL